MFNTFNKFDPKTRRHLFLLLKIVLTIFIISTIIHSINIYLREDNNGPRSKLAVVWTSGDPEVANNVCLMYTHAAKQNNWFDDVRLIVWGPSARLLSQDNALQEKIHAMLQDGIIVEACVACADHYSISENLRAMGIDVKPMGKPLTDYLQTDWKVITF
ncbi:DsrE family protein [candidate division KSB1 bacterium]|nr:DsrE family protein [candidate division KSB1 bacterium]